MQINLSYDSSASSAPAAFFTAMNYCVQYLNNLITNNITVNIQVGWGEVAGQGLPAGNLGEGGAQGIVISYAQLKADLLAHSNSAADTTAYANLPSADISNGAGFLVAAAEAKAWGVIPATGTELDGVIGFSNSAAWNFGASNQAVAGQYNFIGDALHELTHALGRESGLNPGSPMTVMDLFQYAAPGVLQTHAGGSSYFSINGGATNLGNFDTSSDPGDWSNTVPNDSFGAFFAPGIAYGISSTDLTLLNVLGFQVASSSGPVVSTITTATDNSAAQVGASHVVTVTLNTNEAVTVSGVPTVQLSANEVATYAGGSGTNTLTFYYVVQPGDNTSDLHVTGLNLPAGATIQDASGNNLSTSVTADLGVAVNAASTPPATSVQQEVLGLYAALYNRTADAPGLAYWESEVGSTMANGGTTAITTAHAELLGQLFVTTQSTYFNATYGGLNDSQFISALYTNIGGNAGDPGGISYWAQQLATLEAKGASIQTARSEIVGAFVQEFIDYDLSTQPSSLTTAQYQSAVQRQTVFDNKLAVSEMYALLSTQSGGTILDAQTTTDAAFATATRAIQNVTIDPTTAEMAIAHILQAVAHNNLALI